MHRGVGSRSRSQVARYPACIELGSSRDEPTPDVGVSSGHGEQAGSILRAGLLQPFEVWGALTSLLGLLNRHSTFHVPFTARLRWSPSGVPAQSIH